MPPTQSWIQDEENTLVKLTPEKTFSCGMIGFGEAG
jgi:hypothetical protein